MQVTRRRGGGRRRGQLLGTSDEEGSDSAFPARTPEQVKALDDLLEEEVEHQPNVFQIFLMVYVPMVPTNT